MKMIKGKQCETCKGSGQVDVLNYQDGFCPPTMPCHRCGGLGDIAPQPENIEEVAILFAEAFETRDLANRNLKDKQSLYYRWKIGACKNEDGHRL